MQRSKIKTKKEDIKWKKKKKEERKNTLKQKLLDLIFNCSPQSNLSQFNKTIIRNFKLKGLEPKKVPIK